MTPYASPRLVPYLGLAALGLIGALALRRPELVVVAAPFALIVAAGLLFEGRPEVKAWLTLDRERALEGDEIVAEIELEATATVDSLELHLVVPRGLTVVDGDNPGSIRLHAGEERTISLTLRCDRWGAVELGDIFLRARGRIGMLTWEGRIRRPHRIQIYPRPELLQRLVAPLDTQLATGDLVARVRSDGLEFADTRPVRSRRPAPLGQLARERTPRRADRQRAAPRSQRGRRAVPGQLCRGPQRGRARRHARAGRAGRSDARRPLPGAPRPGRARHVRRHPPLARAGRRPGAALSPDRRAPRDRRRVQLRLEGRQHHSRRERCRRRRS